MSISMYLGSAYKLPLPDKSVDLIITNPPFWKTDGVYYGGDQKEQLSHGKESPKSEYWDNLVKATKEMHRVLKDDGSLFILIGQGDYPHLNPVEYEHIVYCTKELGLTLTSEVSWEINQNMYSFENLHTEHQIFRHYTKGPNYTRNAFEISNLNPASWRIPYVENSPELSKLGGLGHGFPIELAARIIRCFTTPKSVILDPFAGTGTVAVASGLYQREGVYLDCSQDQFNVAKKRLELFGLEAVEKKA